MFSIVKDPIVKNPIAKDPIAKGAHSTGGAGWLRAGAAEWTRRSCFGIAVELSVCGCRDLCSSVSGPAWGK